VFPGSGTPGAQHVRVQRIEIDGVPVFTAPGPERVTAALVFGVGHRDETYATAEVTHLVEHLVMGALPKSHLKCNAVTDVDVTAFYATGRPEAVSAFLEGVCRALSDLPTERLELEIGVLQAEDCSTGNSTYGSLWASRYRLAGPGLVATGGPGAAYLTEDVVRAHARRWFVRENAALWWHGEPPAGLSLSLPSGPRPERFVPQPRPQSGPVWTQYFAPGVGLLLGTNSTYDPAVSIGIEVLKERVRDIARHARGLSYHVDSMALDLAPGLREVAVIIDARQGQESEVAQILWEQYAALCATGPTAEEIRHAVDGLEEDLDGDAEGLTESELAGEAFCSVAGIPFHPVAEVLADWRAMTPQRVTDALRAAYGSAVLYVPEGTGFPGISGLHQRWMCNRQEDVPRGTTFRTSALTRLVNKRARVSIVVGDGGLAERDADGDGHLIPWPEIEAVVPADDGKGFQVVGRNMCGIVVHEEMYGRKAVQAVSARIPAHLFLAPPPASRLSPSAGVPVG
jgi:hypothetical protein